MKRLIALVLTLMLLLPLLPLSVISASADESPFSSDAQRAALVRELEQYGSVEAAMDAYAAQVFESYYRYSFDTMLAPTTNAFRWLAQDVEGTDDDINFFKRMLMELGYATVERNFDFASRTNQVNMYINYLLALADMEEISFESVKERSSALMPTVDAGAEAFQYAVEWLGTGASLFSKKVTQATGKMQSNFYRELLSNENLTIEKVEDIYVQHMTKLWQGQRNFTTVLEKSGLAQSALSSFSGLVLPSSLTYVTNAYEKACGGLAMLDSMNWRNFDDAYFADAYSILRQTYWDYLSALSEISTAEELNNADLDQLFNTTLQNNMFAEIWEDWDYAWDVFSTIASVTFDAFLNAFTYELGTVARSSLRLMLEADSHAVSYMMLFHSISVLNEIYDQFAETNQRAALSSWKDYYAYAENTRRMVSLAYVGEEALFTMQNLDANSTDALWEQCLVRAGLQEAEHYDQQWYNYRTLALSSLHEQTEEYMADLLEHYAALSAAISDISDLLGHENEAAFCTLRGVLRQGEYFAKADGSGEPDYSRPNPDYGQYAVNVPVRLLADQAVIAQTTSTDSGAFVLTFSRAAAAGHHLTVQFGEKTAGTFEMKELPIGSGMQITFPSSFGWDPLTQSPMQATTWAGHVPVFYSDEYFIDSTSTTSREMLLASLGLAAAGMSRSPVDGSLSGNTTGILDALGQMGYYAMLVQNYGANLNTLTTEVPYVLGTRQAREFDADQDAPLHRMFALCVGGDVDVPAMAALWYKDGTLIDDAAASIAQSVLQSMQSCIAEDEVVHLWATGFSWGGSIADRVCTKLQTLFSQAGMNVRIHLYTFGAAGDLSAMGTHIAYEQDLIATGLNRQSIHRQLLRNVSAGSREQKVIASVFHQLSNGTRFFNPWWYKADKTLQDSLRHPHVDCEQLHDLFATIAMWNFTNSQDGTDFRQISAEQKQSAIQAALGVPLADVQERLADITLDVLSYAGIPIFTAMPGDLGTQYQKIIQTILEADALLSGHDQTYTLNNRDRESLMNVFLQAVQALEEPTSPYSFAVTHRPEMYFSWVLGADIGTLHCAEEGYLFNAELLPRSPNLMGTVVDKETQEPLHGAMISVNGGNDVHMTLLTDEKGYWETYVAPDVYSVAFRHTGYRMQEEFTSAEMFSSGPVYYFTQMEKNLLPLVTAKLGDFSHYDNDIFYDYEEIMKTRVVSLEEGVPAPDIVLGLKERKDRLGSVYDSIVIQCAWLQPYTIPVPNRTDFRTTDPFGYMSGMFFDAADMGDGHYTYIVEMQGDYPICCTKVLILREADGQLYQALDFSLLGESNCYRGEDPNNSAWVDYTQGVETNTDYGILRQSARFEKQGDYYDLLLITTECDYNGGMAPTQDVTSRYRLIDGVLTLVEQTVAPW